MSVVTIFRPLPIQDVVPPLSNPVPKTTGVCFGTNSSILRLDIPDNPSKPCLSCTKQWCLNQNLAICAGATLGDTDPDTATGKEGDVEARCFRMCIPWWIIRGYSVQVMLTDGIRRTRFASGPISGLLIPPNRLWSLTWSRDQREVGQSRFGHELVLAHRPQMVAGGCTFSFSRQNWR